MSFQDGGGGSSFSMKGVFSALKKTVKEMVRAKFHEVSFSCQPNWHNGFKPYETGLLEGSTVVNIESSNAHMVDGQPSIATFCAERRIGKLMHFLSPS